MEFSRPELAELWLHDGPVKRWVSHCSAGFAVVGLSKGECQRQIDHWLANEAQWIAQVRSHKHGN